MSRILGISWLLLGSWLASGTARAEENPSAAETVYLSVREPESVNESNFAAPMLDRELIRQAFLLAARDELGLATRDVILREDFPERPDEKSVPFELNCRGRVARKDFDIEYLLRHRDDSGHQELWRWVFNVDFNNPASLNTLAEKAEAFSRGELKDVLTKGGWGRPVPAARTSADVSSETQDLLWTWNEISVLAGLRRVHAEIREKGESPELLAALVVGYANLGSLTEYYYSASFKGYYARGLLYAERLLRKTDGSPWALWHRAYVRMQVGLHNFAADDIAAAKKKQGDSKPAKPLPFWCDVLDAFGQGELPRMLKIAKTPPQRHLALYLDLQAVLFSSLEEVIVKVAHTFLEECPECPRAYDVLATTRILGPTREAAYAPFRITGTFLRKRLPDVPGLPESVTRRIRGAAVNHDESAEIKFRRELASELQRAGMPQRDRGEPSLSALAHVVEEIDFAQAMRRLEYESNMISIPTEDSVATLAPLVAGHRYGVYLNAFLRSKSDREGAADELFKHLDPWAFTFKQRSLVTWLYQIMPNGRLHDWFQAPNLHADWVFSDEMRGIGAGYAGEPDDRKYNRPFMKRAWNTSNKLPLAVAMRVSRDWDHARMETDVTERDYAEDPLVTHALADRYYRQKKYDDAERCAKLHVRCAPSYAAYRLLASVYEAKEDHVRWKETLEKSLVLPAYGLEHAAIRNDIAVDFMKRKQWKEAVVYADAAAQSYSSWSMFTAARCHEMLGEWKKSEELIHAISERYDDTYAWLFWCHRTGHGDVQAADEFTRARIEALGTDLSGGQYLSIGDYYLVTGEPEKALLLFQRGYEKGHDPYTAMQMALTADGLGKAAERDAAFQKVITTQMPANTYGARWADSYRQLIGLFREMLPPKKAQHLNQAQLDKIIAAPPPGTFYSSTLPYLVAVFLKNRGDTEAAKTYLIRCAQGDDWQSDNHVLACQMLRDMKVKIPPVDDHPASGPATKAPAESKTQPK